MNNTYTQLFVQLILAVEGRRNKIPANHREMLYQFITAAVQRNGHKLLCVLCMPDHIHLLVGLSPQIALSDLVHDIKRATTNMFNTKQLLPGPFSWQKGYGAFSYSKSQVPDVIRYIRDQEAYHQKRSFREEYRAFLDKFGVAYDERYLFEFYE